MYKLPIIDFSKCSFLDAEVVEFHYGKHHKAYIDNLNKLLPKGESKGLTEVIRSSQGALHNNAAQSFNHTFYWFGITPTKCGINKESKLYQRIVTDFDGIENLKRLFLDSAMSVFGSGWTWLGLNRKTEKLEIINTANADGLPLDTYMPLLVCDVWEHAYYIDYRNSRANYLADFWEAINWGFVSENYEKKDIKRIETTMSG